jgi:tripartite-type tricarboxylate transporter receptor subunit TctC
MKRWIAAVAFTFAAAALHAQAWPQRPVRILVGFPPGGGIDVVARLLGAQMTPSLGQ